MAGATLKRRLTDLELKMFPPPEEGSLAAVLKGVPCRFSRDVQAHIEFSVACWNDPEWVRLREARWAAEHARHEARLEEIGRGHTFGPPPAVVDPEPDPSALG